MHEMFKPSRELSPLTEYQAKLPAGWTVEAWQKEGARIKDGKRISLTFEPIENRRDPHGLGTRITIRRGGKISEINEVPEHIDNRIRWEIVQITFGKWQRRAK